MIYISVDLIPMFPIEKIGAMALARLINCAMLALGHPRGWLRYLFKYPKDYKVIQELVKEEDNIVSVGLKTMNFLEGRNHHVKPAQVQV